ncbi:MAG: PIG-L family deacetylase [Chloroflexi bacterium]|nr:PIG-L family deacetylase [Chloroflexota bacterium]
MPQKRVILAVFAHPDDETSAAGATMARYVREGVDVHVATATRGELGALGTNGLVITREDLPKVREQELRSVLQIYGANPPILFGYRDQEVERAPFEEVIAKILAVMRLVQPDVVITFGPLGISRHADHVAIHMATVDAFHRYRHATDREPRLFFTSIPAETAERFELNLFGPEVNPTVLIDTKETVALKVKALRTYRSQEDAQWLAEVFEKQAPAVEAFHQAYPPIANGEVANGFW